MQWLGIAFIVLIATGIVNAWIIRPSRNTRFRPDGARDIIQEFGQYGFRPRFAYAVGATKLTLAAALVAGIFYEPLVVPSAAALVVLMAGAVGAHLKVNDPLLRAMPALFLLALSVGTIVVTVMA